MIELFGFQLGSVFQGGTLLTALLIAAGLWIKGWPDRKRADNEGRVIDNTEYARQFSEWRKEVHGYKNEVQKLLANQMVSDRKQVELEKLLTHALSTSSVRKDQMNSMMSLIELLIAELERIDPESIIVPQAKVLLKQMKDASLRAVDPLKSSALEAAEHTVHAAKVAVAEVKQAENGE